MDQDLLKENQILMQRRQTLVDAYNQSYDPSFIWQAWADAERKGRGKLVGEGRHFRSYRLAGSRGLDLVMNVAKPSFFQKHRDDLKEWSKNCRKLKGLKHPLLPPFDLMEGLEPALLIVMPYCEEALSLGELNRPALARQLQSFKTFLASEGLELDDYWQLRSCRGLPFVIDYSDLRALGPRAPQLARP